MLSGQCTPVSGSFVAQNLSHSVLFPVSGFPASECATIYFGSTQPGIGATQYGCLGNESQTFTFTPVAAGLYHIEPDVASASATPLCLDAGTSPFVDGGAVVQNTCQSSTSQQWKTSLRPDGFYALETADETECVSVGAAGAQLLSDGAPLVIHACALADTTQEFWMPGFSPSTGELAKSADGFVDSIGVVTHWTYMDTFYYSRYPAVSQLLIDSGIRHIRDGGPGQSAEIYSHFNSLYDRAGIRNECGVGKGDSSTLPDLVSQLVTGLPHVEGVESLNEYDASGDPAWASYLQSYQPALYAAVKANPLTRSLPVVGPSMAQPGSSSALGDLSASIDIGDLHNYMVGHNPGTFGWGGGGYASEPYAIGHERIIGAAKPIWTTETGYNTFLPAVGADGGSTPDTISGRYLPRLLIEQSNLGIRRTYIYQFAAESVDPNGADGSSGYGMIDANQQPKPEYTAVKNLIGLLKDPGVSFTPGTLHYALSGGDASVHHALYEKRDGRFYLAVWIEAPGFNPSNAATPIVPPQALTLWLPNGAQAVTLSQFADTGTLQTTTASFVHGGLALNVTDKLLVIEITP